MSYRIILTGLVLAIVAALAWQFAPQSSLGMTEPAQPTVQAKLGEPAPDFILQSADGPLQLSQLEGAQVLFFGFSHCPDVCPTGLATLSAAWNKLPKAQRQQIQGIFISLDPERDTPERMAQYVDWFNANLHGVTGSEQAIDQLAQTYSVFYRRVELPNSQLGYSIDHSAHYYLINAEGILQARVPHGSTVETLTEALSQLAPSS